MFCRFYSLSQLKLDLYLSLNLGLVSIKTFLVKIIATGVHDSFWTHACDVDKLNRILREKFVELYSQPILENVSSIICLYLQLVPVED